MIHREDDEIYETLEVELHKKKDRGLGLSIVGKKSGPGVYISEVVKGGAADSDVSFQILFFEAYFQKDAFHLLRIKIYIYRRSEGTCQNLGLL